MKKDEARFVGVRKATHNSVSMIGYAPHVVSDQQCVTSNVPLRERWNTKGECPRQKNQYFEEQM